MTEGAFVSTGPEDGKATEGAVDGIGAGSLLPTVGLIGGSFAEVVDGTGIELKSWAGVGAGGSPLEVADGMVVEPKSWVGTGTGAGAGAGMLMGFASEEESRADSKLPPRGGEAGST